MKTFQICLQILICILNCDLVNCFCHSDKKNLEYFKMLMLMNLHSLKCTEPVLTSATLWYSRRVIFSDQQIQNINNIKKTFRISLNSMLLLIELKHAKYLTLQTQLFPAYGDNSFEINHSNRLSKLWYLQSIILAIN